MTQAIKWEAGDRVYAVYDESSGEVSLYSDDGTLSPDWLRQNPKVCRSKIKSIRVRRGIVFLPENARGYDIDKWLESKDEENGYSLFGGLSALETIEADKFDVSSVKNIV